MNLERIHGIPARIASLKAKLAARDGKKEYAENCVAIRAEIARLEAATIAKAERVASQDQSGNSANPGNVT